MELATDVAGLVLRPLGEGDLERYADLVSRNRGHLTRHGDYQEVVDASSAELASELSEHVAGRFGVWLDTELIGRVDLIPKDGTNAVLGYWIDRDRFHSGVATAACRTLLRFGVERLSITDAWAGVTHGNDRSVALVRRLGFEDVGDIGSYTGSTSTFENRCRRYQNGRCDAGHRGTGHGEPLRTRTLFTGRAGSAERPARLARRPARSSGRGSSSCRGRRSRQACPAAARRRLTFVDPHVSDAMRAERLARRP
jgi:RimJ/RimL family protein N-acetyltransferase